MVMKPEPWGEALRRAARRGRRRPSSFTTPSGQPFTQAVARELADPRAPGLRLRSLRGHRPAGRRRGRHPGRGPRDLARRLRAQRRRGGRARDHRGRRPAGARASWATPASLVEESHEDGLLEYPVYTKPAVVARPRRARRCCCSGDHARDRGLAPRPGGTPHRASAGPTCAPVGAARRRRDPPRRAGRRRRALRAPAGLLGAGGSTTTPASRSRRCTSRSTTCAPGSARDTVLVARSAGRLVGAVRGSLRRRRDLGHRPADGRPRPAPGAAWAALLLGRIEAAAPAGATSYALFTGAGSLRNQRMYKKAGYRLRGELEPGVGPDDQALPGADFTR